MHVRMEQNAEDITEAQITGVILSWLFVAMGIS